MSLEEMEELEESHFRRCRKFQLGMQQEDAIFPLNELTNSQRTSSELGVPGR